mmetsp:Transcript_118781/g.236606  ORF Transcript_118781/g.236606 Transcript_118781/m.236606 type:complete len:358 (-) Transcript_118781:69-1142(-)
MAHGSEASWPHSQPASPLPVLGSPLPGSPEPPASPREQTSFVGLANAQPDHRSFRERLLDFAVEHEQLQARNEVLVSENRDLRERLERVEAACGRGGGHAPKGVGGAVSRVGGGNLADEVRPTPLPSEQIMRSALPLWRGSKEVSNNFVLGHPGGTSGVGDVEGFEKRVERLLSSKPAHGGTDKTGSAREAVDKSGDGGSGSSSSTDESDRSGSGRKTHRRRRRQRRRRSRSKPRRRIRQHRRGGDRCRNRGPNCGRSRSRKRQPPPATQPAPSTNWRADPPRGFFGSGDHQRDLQDFCSKNQLEARVVAALHSMSEANQRKVMGTDGSGENSYLLVDRVKNPNGVVMSRIRKVGGG